MLLPLILYGACCWPESSLLTPTPYIIYHTYIPHTTSHPQTTNLILTHIAARLRRYSSPISLGIQLSRSAISTFLTSSICANGQHRRTWRALRCSILPRRERGVCASSSNDRQQPFGFPSSNNLPVAWWPLSIACRHAEVGQDTQLLCRPRAAALGVFGRD